MARFARGAVGTGLALALTLTFSLPTQAGGEVEDAVAAATGIDRAISPALQAIAAQRVQEIQPYENFSHAKMQTAEVLGFTNVGEPISRMVYLWEQSEDHWTLLTDRSLNAIGCAMDETDGVYWFACALAHEQSNSVSYNSPFVQDSGTVIEVPDTAMRKADQ